MAVRQQPSSRALASYAHAPRQFSALLPSLTAADISCNSGHVAGRVKKDCSFDRLHYMDSCSSYRLIPRRDMGETKNWEWEKVVLWKDELHERQTGKTVGSDRLTRCCEGCLIQVTPHSVTQEAVQARHPRVEGEKKRATAPTDAHVNKTHTLADTKSQHKYIHKTL